MQRMTHASKHANTRTSSQTSSQTSSHATTRTTPRRGAAFELPLVPFGVFLAPAGMVTLLWGTALIDWYLATLVG